MKWPKHLRGGAECCPLAVSSHRHDGPGIYCRCLPLGGDGSGAASRQILGTVVVGGMTLSTVLGLIFIPVTFSVVEYLSHRFVQRGQGHHDGFDLRPGSAVPRATRRRLSRTPARKVARHEAVFANSFRLSLLAGAISWLAGCNVGPKYVRPNYPAPPAFRGADNAAVASDTKESLGDEQWSAVYREPELQALIRKALANNYDVRIAAQRILEQQAQVRITRSQEFPSFTVGGTGIGAALPASLGTQIPSPLADGLRCVSLVDAGFLGTLSQTDRGRSRAVIGAGVGAAGGSSDACRSGRDRVSAVPRARCPT